MPNRRNIDERDIDKLLAALTDTQIASLFGMSEIEVFKLRRARDVRQGPSMTSDRQDDNPET